ncbi:unnamed protein product [Tilletia laevis]|nr:unnamed protein product [Tilletia laevis]
MPSEDWCMVAATRSLDSTRRTEATLQHPPHHHHPEPHPSLDNLAPVSSLHQAHHQASDLKQTAQQLLCRSQPLQWHKRCLCTVIITSQSQVFISIKLLGTVKTQSTNSNS